MLKNITLSADEKLIEDARKKAQESKTTLNHLFRQWLTGYARKDDLSGKLDAFLAKTIYVASGRSFTRDELNER